MPRRARLGLFSVIKVLYGLHAARTEMTVLGRFAVLGEHPAAVALLTRCGFNGDLHLSLAALKRYGGDDEYCGKLIAEAVEHRILLTRCGDMQLSLERLTYQLVRTRGLELPS